MNSSFSGTVWKPSTFLQSYSDYSIFQASQDQRFLVALAAILIYVFASISRSNHPFLYSLVYTAFNFPQQTTIEAILLFWVICFTTVSTTKLLVHLLASWVFVVKKNGSYGRDNASYMEESSDISEQAFTTDIQDCISSESRGLRRSSLVSTSNASPTRSRGAKSVSLKPLLFPSQTTHRRLFPVRHSFSYSYLLVGVPITNQNQWYGSMLSSHNGSYDTNRTEAKTAWFSVNSPDYLQRGLSFHKLSFRSKLETYLESQSVDPTKYPFAYLVTAPRFLDWSFNPVSFWYLYDREMTFSAMILEVNNTFDERRMYFLQPDADSVTDPDHLNLNGHGASDCFRFSTNWCKDFHVSPFNDRSGSYSVRALDVVAKGQVDVTIVLRDDDLKAKLVARVNSTVSSTNWSRYLHVQKRSQEGRTRRAIDPRCLSAFERATFLIRYGYIGFLTNPRILREARILWTKGLKVYYRPEPVKSTVGRNESSNEMMLESYFRGVLESLSWQQHTPVHYVPAAGPKRGRALQLGVECTSTEQTEAQIQEGNGFALPPLRVQVLTPAFYLQLARVSTNLYTIFDPCLFSAKQGEALVWTSDDSRLRKLLEHQSLSNGTPTESSSNPISMGFKQVCIAILRQPRNVDCLVKFFRAWGLQGQQRRTHMSEFDELVHEQSQSREFLSKSSPPDEASGEALSYDRYEWTVLAVLLADRLAFGSSALLRLQISFCRLLLITVTTNIVVVCLQRHMSAPR